jgi:membrane protein
MRPSDRGQLPRIDDRPPIWATVTTIALFVAGFRPRRLSPVPVDHMGAPDEGRGRLASAPSEISARGWKDILLRVFHSISEHRIIALAAGVTFYTLLAIFPAIAALVAIYGLFSDPATLTVHLEKLSGLLPGGAIDVIRDELTRVASQRDSTLGLTFIVGLAVSLWSANAAMKSVFDTLNVAYAETEAQSLIKLNAISLAFTAAGIVFVLVAIAALVVLPSALKYLGLSELAEFLVWAGR